MTGADLVDLAREVATRAHAGQFDKAGAPYIGHPGRVAARVVGDPLAESVAWLHDVLEDTAVTESELAGLFPAPVVAAVVVLTRLPDEDPDAYYARVRADPLALTVKWADIDDNCDPARAALLDPATRERLAAKYAHAREQFALRDD